MAEMTFKCKVINLFRAKLYLGTKIHVMAYVSVGPLSSMSPLLSKDRTTWRLHKSLLFPSILPHF